MKMAFEEKRKQFDLVNVDMLKEAGRYLIPALDMVLERFYERARADPEASGFFLSEQQFSSARSAQKKHWERLLSGDLGQKYVESTDRIGRVHARINLPMYTYMSAYACAASHLMEVLIEKQSRGVSLGANKKLAKMAGAVSRALALDIELVVDTTFTVWGEEQKRAFTYLEDGIGEMSNGNLAHMIPGPEESDYPAAYDEVRVKLNDATKYIGDVMQRISTSMGTLLRVVEDVSQATDELSRRTVSQAASLEETAAALNELTESVMSSTERTKETSSVGKKAEGEVKNGANVITAAAQAMETIQNSSDSISQITGMIEDVAFQTNLLALNAGVEAARAGEAGRGFAVVASEVRSLAVRSSDAARDIKGLIENSGRSVAEGVDLIQKADTSFSAIVSSFDQVSHLTSDIASASREQSTGLKEINVSVSEMDKITQMNAGMVEKTLGAMQMMRDQALDLQEVLADLQFGDAEANSDEQMMAFKRKSSAA